MRHTMDLEVQQNYRGCSKHRRSETPCKFMRECKSFWHINHLLIRQIFTSVINFAGYLAAPLSKYNWAFPEKKMYPPC